MPVPTCVIYNPTAGRGKARSLFSAARSVAPDAVFRPTMGPRHASELAAEAAREGFGRVIAAGGDGTVHEVANGLLSSGRDVILSTWPVGSMNDYAHALGLDRWWAGGRREPLAVIAADVGVIRAAGRERFFVNGVGIGFTGMVTVESTRIRSLRGLPLYSLALLRATVRHFATPPMTVRLDDREVSEPTLTVSVALGRREGGFPLFPAARVDDGWFDYLHVGRARRWDIIRHFPAVVRGRLPTDHPHVHTGRCRTATVQAQEELCAHADGEMFCQPGDGVTRGEVELLPGRLRVETCPAFRPGGETKTPTGTTGGRGEDYV